MSIEQISPNPITDPDEFYRSEVAGDLRYAFGIVLMTALLSMSGTGFLFYKAWPAVNGSQVATVIWTLTTLSLPVTVLLSWGLYTGAFYVLSKWFDTRNDFRTLLSYTGWGFLPQLLGSTISFVLIVAYTSSMAFPTSLSRIGPFMQSITGSALFTVLSLLGIVFTVWSAFIWVFAVKNCRNITTKQATYTIALPVLLSICYKIYNLPMVS
jgi:hypothetical protein